MPRSLDDIIMGVAEYECSQIEYGPASDTPIGVEYWDDEPVLYNDGSVAQVAHASYDEEEGMRHSHVVFHEFGLCSTHLRGTNNDE